MRFAIVVRATASKRGDRSAPWRLVGLLLEAFGWKLEGIHELKRKTLPALPEKTAEEVQAERRAALVAMLESVRDEREGFRQALGMFDSVEQYVVAELAQPGAAQLDPLPQNVFTIGACTSARGRHSFVRIPSTKKGGAPVLRCSRCHRMAWVNSSHEAAEVESATTDPDPAGELN